MSSRDSITAQGTITEVLRDGAYRAELANGHRFVASTGANETAEYHVGDIVLLSFHPYDLSRGRIVEDATAIYSPR